MKNYNLENILTFIAYFVHRLDNGEAFEDELYVKYLLKELTLPPDGPAPGTTPKANPLQQLVEKFSEFQKQLSDFTAKSDSQFTSLSSEIAETSTQTLATVEETLDNQTKHLEKFFQDLLEEQHQKHKEALPKITLANQISVFDDILQDTVSGCATFRNILLEQDLAQVNLAELQEAIGQITKSVYSLLTLAQLVVQYAMVVIPEHLGSQMNREIEHNSRSMLYITHYFEHEIFKGSNLASKNSFYSEQTPLEPGTLSPIHPIPVHRQNRILAYIGEFITATTDLQECLKILIITANKFGTDAVEVEAEVV